jgi:catechol-2,3-dioxygenase
MIDQDHISFGPVHLEVIDLGRTSRFWERLFGFVSRTGENDTVEISAADETLIVVHRVPWHLFGRDTVSFVT